MWGRRRGSDRRRGWRLAGSRRRRSGAASGGRGGEPAAFAEVLVAGAFAELAEAGEMDRDLLEATVEVAIVVRDLISVRRAVESISIRGHGPGEIEKVDPQQAPNSAAA